MSPETPPERSRVPADWELSRTEGGGSAAPSDWVAARVPGAVQLDWGRAHRMPDLLYGSNVALYAGLEDHPWTYRTRVPEAPRSPGERLFFVCEGLDYEGSVVLGETAVLRHTGPDRFEIDVSDTAPGTFLEVRLLPAPKRTGAPPDRSQASHVTKPAVSYGWDWHPRLIPLGIGGRADFEVRPAVHVRRVDVAYVLEDDFRSAALTVRVEASEAAAAVTWRLLSPEGVPVLESAAPRAVLDRPRLWWCHDHGSPDLYTLEVTLAGGETVRRRVGFRRVRLVMHAGAWERELSMPKSRNEPPVTLELNGRRIFAKGSNWVCSDLFPGRVSRETYAPLIALARRAHFNLLRCWGGAPAEKEAFYDLCDETGLLVWQEFPLACNEYPDDPAYLAQLDRESRALIGRVRQHPCLCLWVGGNELFNAWSRMTDQSLALRLLNRNCYDLDPQTPFLPTSPVEGMGHGDYRFRNAGRDVFETFQAASCTAYSEFGCPGASPVDYLKTFIPPAELFPPRPGGAWQVHHGLGAWEADPTTWLCLGILENCFGPSATLEELVGRSAWLQGEGYRSIYEEARRQQPRCSMALSWCYNEPWPTAANNSLINWPARPKPAYDCVRLACRPVLASARIPHFQWRGGDLFSAQLWILNDGMDPVPAGTVRAHLLIGDRRLPLGEWAFPAVPAQTNVSGPTLSLELPDMQAEAFTLELATEPDASASSAYRLSLRARRLPPLA